MNNELISVIVPVYNVEKYLERCIRSILKQTYKNNEIILVDDGSKDKSGIICDKYMKIYKNIKVFHKENGGVSSARNIGLKNSSGKYILFVDSDDYLEENMIENMIENLKTQKAQVVQCEYNEVDEDGKIIKSIHNSKLKAVENSYDIVQEFLERNITISLWNKIFSKSVLENIYFDEEIHHYEDKLFILRVLLQCNKISYLNEPEYNYVKRENSVSYDLFKVSYLEILDVDEKIEAEIMKKYPNIIIKVKKNQIEDKLELVKMMVKSRKYLQYKNDYESIKKDIILNNKEIIKELKNKRKLEYILFKWFNKIYIILYSIKR